MDTTSGVHGPPTKAKPRVDFRVDDFTTLIETKGYRVAWSRGALCPCTPINDQTQQSDPNCSLCRGSGWLWFAPAQATVNTLLVGELDPVQLRIVNDNAAVIRAIQTGIGKKWTQYDPIGSRLEGTMQGTVRHENKLGYHDRITNLDSTIVYQEILDALNPADTLVLETRYPIVQVNLLRSATTVYVAPTDFSINASGDILWVDGKAPVVGTRLVCHYLCHPTWLVVEHPHAVRLTQITRKVKKPVTPVGNPTNLPIQAVLKYEFLPELA
jgi:hypothetical protein